MIVFIRLTSSTKEMEYQLFITKNLWTIKQRSIAEDCGTILGVLGTHFVSAITSAARLMHNLTYLKLRILKLSYQTVVANSM